MYHRFDDIEFQGQHGISSLELTYASRVPEQQLTTGGSVIQYTGENTVKCSLGIKLMYTFINVPAAIARLHAKRKQGKKCDLTDGTGVLIGTFVISEMTVTELLRNPSGELLMAEVSLRLIETQRRGETTDAAANATAIIENNILPVRVAALAPTPAGQVVSLVQGAQADAKAAALATRLAATSSDATPSNLRRVASLASAIQRKVTKAVATIEEGQTNIAQPGLLLDDLKGLGGIAQRLFGAALRGDLTDVRLSVGDVVRSSDTAARSSRPTAIGLILRKL